ncbi:MAG: cation:proton antiporter [Cyanobacteria bacterium P01_F01_bin.33]
MDASFSITALMVVTLVAGISAQVLANFTNVPSIVFLLGFGALLGQDGLGIIRPQLLGIGLEVIVSLSVALILFEGGLNLKLADLSRVSKSLRNLVTVGATVTLTGGAVAAHYLSEFPWPIAFVYAALVVVTGPTVVNPILQRIRVGESVSTLLEGEGVLIDPIGAILAVAVLNVVLAGAPDTPELALAAGQLLATLALGAVIGGVGGGAIGLLLRRYRKFFGEELTNCVVLAAALGLYALSQSILSESGLMAAVTAGLVVRQTAEIKERQVRRFQGQLVTLAISVLFVLLTANLSLGSIRLLGWGAAATVAVLMMVVRPLSVWLCTLRSNFSWREKLFVSWLAPRGIVAASVSSLFALVLAEHNITGGEAVKALVFLTIAITVVIQGLSAGTVAKLLGLEGGGAIAIVSDRELGFQLAGLLCELKQPVSLIVHPSTSGSQSNLPILITEECHAIAGSALDESVLTRARIDRAERLLVLTLNADLNCAIAEFILTTFKPPQVMTALLPDTLSSDRIQVLPWDTSKLEDWERYIQSESTRIAALHLPQLSTNSPPTYATYLDLDASATLRPPLPAVSPTNFAELKAQLQEAVTSDRLLPLVARRQQRVMLLPTTADLKPGDRLYCLEREWSAAAICYRPIAPTPAAVPEATDMPPPLSVPAPAS